MSRNQAAPNIVVFPERTPARQAPRKAKTVKAADLPRRAALEDQRAVIERLEVLMDNARAGYVSGFMVVKRDPEGGFSCASAGWCKRHKDESIRFGILGILSVCDTESAS